MGPKAAASDSARAVPIVTYLGGYHVLYLVAVVIGAAGAVLVGRIRGWTNLV